MRVTPSGCVACLACTRDRIGAWREGSACVVRRIRCVHCALCASCTPPVWLVVLWYASHVITQQKGLKSLCFCVLAGTLRNTNSSRTRYDESSPRKPWNEQFTNGSLTSHIFKSCVSTLADRVCDIFMNTNSQNAWIADFIVIVCTQLRDPRRPIRRHVHEQFINR